MDTPKRNLFTARYRSSRWVDILHHIEKACGNGFECQPAGHTQLSSAAAAAGRREKGVPIDRAVRSGHVTQVCTRG